MADFSPRTILEQLGRKDYIEPVIRETDKVPGAEGPEKYSVFRVMGSYAPGQCLGVSRLEFQSLLQAGCIAFLKTDAFGGCWIATGKPWTGVNT